MPTIPIWAAGRDAAIRWMRALAAGLTAALAGAWPAAGQTIQPRVVAAAGTAEPTLETWESAVAAGPDQAIALFNVGPRATCQLGLYAE